MKNELVANIIGAILITVAAILKIQHIPAGNWLLSFSLVALLGFYIWYSKQLKNRIAILEKELRKH